MSEVELNAPPAGGYSVTLPCFEGPLDLLLHLCQKHELDILDIPIAFITEKYLEYLTVMQLMSLDVASEYLVMAATLAHIKSKMLLPAPPPGQEDDIAAEEEDPREALIRRLLEYQKYKHAGEELSARGVAGRDVFLRGMPIEEAVQTGLPPLAQVPLFSLVEAFQNVLAKRKIKLSHDIVHERITLTDRINELVDILRVKRRIAFEDLFTEATTRFELVITFLALLEMTRLRMTRLFQADFDSTIYVEFTAQLGSEETGPAQAEPTQPPGEGDETSAATEPPSADPEGPDAAGPASGWTDRGAITDPGSSFDTEPPDAGDEEPGEPAASDASEASEPARTHTIPCPRPPDGTIAEDGADPPAQDEPPQPSDPEAAASATEPPSDAPPHAPDAPHGEADAGAEDASAEHTDGAEDERDEPDLAQEDPS